MRLADREEIIENEMKLDPVRAARAAVASYFFPYFDQHQPQHQIEHRRRRNHRTIESHRKKCDVIVAEMMRLVRRSICQPQRPSGETDGQQVNHRLRSI